MRIGADSDEAEAVIRLAEQAATVAHPRAMYGLAFVEVAGDDTITIDGVTFKSRVLRVNLDAARKVYLFIVKKGNTSVRRLNRAPALLLASEDKPDTAIADA